VFVRPQTSSVFGSSVVGGQMVLVAVPFGERGSGSGVGIMAVGGPKGDGDSIWPWLRVPARRNS
jgi:hypothetical protein